MFFHCVSLLLSILGIIDNNLQASQKRRIIANKTNPQKISDASDKGLFTQLANLLYFSRGWRQFLICRHCWLQRYVSGELFASGRNQETQREDKRATGHCGSSEREINRQRFRRKKHGRKRSKMGFYIS